MISYSLKPVVRDSLRSPFIDTSHHVPCVSLGNRSGIKGSLSKEQLQFIRLTSDEMNGVANDVFELLGGIVDW